MTRRTRAAGSDGSDDAVRIAGMLKFETALWRQGLHRVAGVDEAGIGPLAGPVVAAVVLFPPGITFPGADDSKKLSPAARRELEPEILAKALDSGLGLATRQEIDQLNVYRAGLLAMRRAVDCLRLPPEHLLIDGRIIPDLPISQTRIFKGDQLSLTIAAASILAKNHRDRIMERLDSEFPGYGFAQHKGYGTAGHFESLRRLGPCPEHRLSFPVVLEIAHRASPVYQELATSVDSARSIADLTATRTLLKRRRALLTESEYRRLAVRLSRKGHADPVPQLPFPELLEPVYDGSGADQPVLEGSR